jgi:Fic family protein
MVMDELKTFLSESNAIEGVYDADSLKQALYAWEYLSEKKELNPSVICKIHKILMLHQRLQPDEKGYFRKRQVMIGGREGLLWTLIPDKIQQWCEVANLMVNYPGSGKRIEQDIQNHHVSYEHIHPFIDGNGRTGRMFLNWQRVRLGLPLLIIQEKEKQAYYDWFSTGRERNG